MESSTDTHKNWIQSIIQYMKETKDYQMIIKKIQQCLPKYILAPKTNDEDSTQYYSHNTNLASICRLLSYVSFCYYKELNNSPTPNSGTIKNNLIENQQKVIGYFEKMITLNQSLKLKSSRINPCYNNQISIQINENDLNNSLAISRLFLANTYYLNEQYEPSYSFAKLLAKDNYHNLIPSDQIQLYELLTNCSYHLKRPKEEKITYLKSLIDHTQYPNEKKRHCLNLWKHLLELQKEKNRKVYTKKQTAIQEGIQKIEEHEKLLSNETEKTKIGSESEQQDMRTTNKTLPKSTKKQPKITKRGDTKRLTTFATRHKKDPLLLATLAEQETRREQKRREQEKKRKESNGANKNNNLD